MNSLRILWISASLIGFTWGQVSPPLQAAPWSLPEGVADPGGKIKEAVDTLFRLGMADPRGCAYRQVTVREGGKDVEARGWVLPSKADESQHAIGWNGLIYPVERVGNEADLVADLELLKKHGDFSEAPISNYQDESLERLQTVFAATPRLMRASAAPYLLLRLGHSVVFDEESAIDPFNEVPFDFGKAGKLTFPAYLRDSVESWLVGYALLLRADGVAAFVDKNDELAATRLPAFDRVWAEVEKRLPHVEGEKEVNPLGNDPFKNFPTRPKLNPVWRSILADAQRRLDPVISRNLPEVAKEIATWDRLETWDEESPPATFEKVVAAGSAAIDPLLDCLEKDTRWTRICESEGTYRRRILRVRDLAIVAMERVLRFRVIGRINDDDSPAEDSQYADAASTMQAFCRKYDHACGGELWFRVLADPAADLVHQRIAAESIVRPDGTEDLYPDTFFPDEARERFNNPSSSREGKLLRGRRDPAVLDLLKQSNLRARNNAEEQLARGAPEGSIGSCGGGVSSFPRGIPNQFVRLMEEWQPGNVEVLKSHYDWLAAALAKVRMGDASGASMLSSACEETLIRRLWAKDKSAMQDYEKLFRSSLDFNAVPIQVMTEFPEHPGMDSLAREAFLGDKAPLSLTKPWTRYQFNRQHQIGGLGERSALLVLSSFRQALIEALKTQTKQGTLAVTQEGGVLKFDAGIAGEDEAIRKDAALRCSEAVGTAVEVRLCDLIAYFLTPKRGSEVWASPAYHLDDSLPARDRAIAVWIGVLSGASPP